MNQEVGNNDMSGGFRCQNLQYRQINQSPENQLLSQIQEIISEFEKEKISEETLVGKL